MPAVLSKYLHEILSKNLDTKNKLASLPRHEYSQILQTVRKKEKDILKNEFLVGICEADQAQHGKYPKNGTNMRGFVENEWIPLN